MLRNIAEPRNPGRLQRHIGIEPTRDGAVNDSLLLLDQQRNHPPLRPNSPVQPSVRPVQEPHDRRLLDQRRHQHRNPQELLRIQPQPGAVDAGRAALVLRRIQRGAQQVICIGGQDGAAGDRPVDAIGRADDAGVPRDTQGGHPCPQGVDDQIARPADLVADVRLSQEHRDRLHPTRCDAGQVRHRQQFLFAGRGPLVDLAEQTLRAQCRPMCRNRVQPVLTGILVVGIRLEIGDHAASPGSSAPRRSPHRSSAFIRAPPPRPAAALPAPSHARSPGAAARAATATAAMP